MELYELRSGLHNGHGRADDPLQMAQNYIAANVPGVPTRRLTCPA